MRILILASLLAPPANCQRERPVEHVDLDEDGQSPEEGDCNDHDASIKKSDEEDEIDGNCIDENCDGYVSPGGAAGAVDQHAVILCGANRESAGSAVAVSERSGAADLIVGSPLAQSGGAVYVIPSEAIRTLAGGGMKPLADLATSALTGPDGSETGSALLGNDVNSDGEMDILIGAPGYVADWASVGSVYLVYGPLGGDIDLAEADFQLTGASEGASQLGASLAAGHIVDSEGPTDILAGAPVAWGSGAVGLVIGASGLDASLRTLDDADVVFYGAQSEDLFGKAISTVGDADGDGLDDALIGARGWDESGTDMADAGRAFLLLGAVAASASQRSTWEDLVPLPGEVGHGHAGAAVAGGDTSGSGTAQLLVATSCGPTDPELDVDCTDVAWLVDPQGSFADALPLSSGTAIASWTHVSDVPVSLSLRDLDGDDALDLLIGVPGVDQETGAVYAISGPLEGTNTLDDAFLTGEYRHDLAGTAVDAAGHFGTASEDSPRLIIGAPGRDDDGAVYLVPGALAFR